MPPARSGRPLRLVDRDLSRRRLPRIGLGAFVLGALLLVTASVDWHLRHYWLDDPYISFRYAWNLVHGNGLTYNPRQHIEGFSNPSWTLLSAGALAVGLDPLIFSKVVGAGLHLAAVVVVWMGVRGVGGTRASPPAASGLCARVTTLLPATLAGAVVATSSWTALWALAGLETALFAFALVAAVTAYQAERRTTAAAFMLLAALTRIEGIVFGLAFAVVLLRERGLSRGAKRPLLLLFVPFLTALLLRVAYYGHVLPNSYTDKTGLALSDSFRAGTRYLVVSLRAELGQPTTAPVQGPTVMLVLALLAVTGLVMLWALLRVRNARGGARWLTATSLWGVVAITVGGGGDWMPAARFLVPAVPLVGLTLGWALTALLRRWPVGFTSVRRLVATACVMAAAAALVVVGQGQKGNVVAAVGRYQPTGTPDVYRNPHYVAMARWLQAHTRPGDLIGIEEAGLIPYETPELRYLDLFGLTDETIARASGVPPFDRHDNSYVLASQARYLVIWGVPNGHGGFRWSHQLSLVRDRRFGAEYQPVFSAPKDNHYTFVAYEKTGPQAELG